MAGGDDAGAGALLELPPALAGLSAEEVAPLIAGAASRYTGLLCTMVLVVRHKPLPPAAWATVACAAVVAGGAVLLLVRRRRATQARSES